MFDPRIRKPVSLKQITGKGYDVIALAKELCVCLNNRWQSLFNISKEELLKEYSSHLYKINQQARFKIENEIFSGEVKGINTNGELLIQKGTQPPLSYQTIEWVLPV